MSPSDVLLVHHWSIKPVKMATLSWFELTTQYQIRSISSLLASQPEDLMTSLCFASAAPPRFQRLPHRKGCIHANYVVSPPLRRTRILACARPNARDTVSPTTALDLGADAAPSVKQHVSERETPPLSPDRAYFGEDEGKYQPLLAGAATLALRNFSVEVRALFREIRRGFGFSNEASRQAPPDCLGLRLSNARIIERERERERLNGAPAVWPPVRFAYAAVCVGLDVLYDGRPIERFWVLETVARLPYLAYTSCLHLLSTLGWYRSVTLMSLHRAEDTNENFHLAVMESLGGDQRWLVSVIRAELLKGSAFNAETDCPPLRFAVCAAGSICCISRKPGVLLVSDAIGRKVLD